MKKVLLYILFFTVTVSVAQSKYRTSVGEIRFNASTPLEDIAAVNEKVNAIIETESGKFAAVMLIKDFNFRRKLMQEHFNENYMESDKYPKAYFSGTIKDLEFSKLNNQAVDKSISGKLTIHGVTRELYANVRISNNADKIQLISTFIIRPEDHDIEVPKSVFKKIAQEVQVDVEFDLQPE